MGGRSTTKAASLKPRRGRGSARSSKAPFMRLPRRLAGTPGLRLRRADHPQSVFSRSPGGITRPSSGPSRRMVRRTRRKFSPGRGSRGGPPPECIGWSLPCPSIFASSEGNHGAVWHPGCAAFGGKNTLKRIAKGVVRYVLRTTDTVHRDEYQRPFPYRHCRTAGNANDGQSPRSGAAVPCPPQPHGGLLCVFQGGRTWILPCPR